MIRLTVASLALLSAAACAVTPQAVPAGLVSSPAGFDVTLKEDWSRWPEQLNTTTVGEYLTKDGLLLNRLHFASIESGKPWIRAAKDADVPRYRQSASEIETVDFIVSSLKRIGYSEMAASNIRPESLDDQKGIRFDLQGKWENGLNVRGDAAFVPSTDGLKLVLFMAPAIHYYDASAEEVDEAIQSINLL
ncbi:hypothetical protein K1X12_02800 [Hyphomonas sp. WL0036]|uniref:hypothetical protein n=1 Tax=Hyphomonas sediminis TaxID=2866160 RepID=UPI001C813509|nr:hypothetical protein [Hyphomonas sediminis]MBY9065807.1 hypothetical protein [Hyphomonas sediminis]